MLRTWHAWCCSSISDIPISFRRSCIRFLYPLLPSFVAFRQQDIAFLFSSFVHLFLQAWTKYLRQTLVPCEIAHYGKIWTSIFQQFFASINKSFILGGEEENDHLVKILWRFEIWLSFPNFLRSKVLSRSATSEASLIYHVYF